jgi:hypothetical protein
MESSIKRVFSREEKKTILSFTLDNLGKAAFKGLILGGAATVFLKNRSVGLFIFSYMLGRSLRESNDFIFINYKA